MTRLNLILFSIFLLSAAKAFAEDPPAAFRPPQPPSIDPAADFDDMEDDLMEMGDDGFRPPPPPPPPGGASSGGTNVPVTPGFDHGNAPSMPVGGGNFGGNSGKAKIQFKLVDGEYWEKGKKRPRGHSQKRASVK